MRVLAGVFTLLIAVGHASAEQPGAHLMAGKILPFYVDQASAIQLKGESSGQVTVAVRGGTAADWAATAAAIAKETVRYTDYVKVMIMRENPIGYEPPWDLKQLAIAYYGPNPRITPWPTKPFDILIADRVATDQDIVFEEEYGNELQRLLDNKYPPERADQAALKFIQQKHHLKTPWEIPLSNVGGQEINGANVVAEGDFPPEIERIRKCLQNPLKWSPSCK